MITRRTSPPTRQQLASFHDRLREMDPGIERSSSRYHAALLLLALTALPSRIDHLAQWLSLPREFVARCIRRLIDNGVLQRDGLVGGWVGTVGREDAFWADVNVARGLWQRRLDTRGDLEWVEAGVWQKPYDYTPSAATSASTRYIAQEGWRPQLHIECLGGWRPSGGPRWIGETAAAAAYQATGAAGIQEEGGAAEPMELRASSLHAPEALAGRTDGPSVVWLS